MYADLKNIGFQEKPYLLLTSWGFLEAKPPANIIYI